MQTLVHCAICGTPIGTRVRTGWRATAPCMASTFGDTAEGWCLSCYRSTDPPPVHVARKPAEAKP